MRNSAIITKMSYELREKCAVAGVVTTNDEVHASAYLYEELFALQHRGAEASGMVSDPEGSNLQYRRANGLVRDVYNEEHMQGLVGSIAIGHNRYSTNGARSGHFQPYIDKPIGLAFAHNGNLPVTKKLEANLQRHNIRTEHYNDSEMMGLAIAQNIRDGHTLVDAVEAAYPLFQGAFSCVAMHDGVMVAFRDSKGIRPLALGEFDGNYTVASETCGLDIIGASYTREVEPGEMVIITENGFESRTIVDSGESKLDMFEYVYFARHDSMLYDQRVNEVRRRFGEKLALAHPPKSDDIDNILVVPVPDTSVPAAEGYADALGLRHGQAIIKNRYIGRTFMANSQKKRKQQLRRKHNMIPEIIEGKDLILIDDSIVRGNTMPIIVELAHELGAKTVTVLIASPPVRFPDFYGIDTPEQSKLLAAVKNREQMRRKINDDHLGFLSVSQMVNATGISSDKFNLSSFTGQYPIPIGKENRKKLFIPKSMEDAE